jgi:hypothetical protein
MKCAFVGSLVLVFVAITGCNLGTRGGPGASDPNAKSPLLYGQSDGTFNLSVPNTSTTVRQGETNSTAVGIKRGANFDEEVTLSFAAMPRGVTIDPQHPIIKRGETDAKLTFKAADDASLGDFTLRVTGQPTKGADASNEFRITVAKG